MKSALLNTTPTLFAPNCLAGILYHDLGLQFRSPTINTMMLQTDFAKLVLDLDHYLEQKLIFFKHPDYECPCAYLDDIVIHFTHYDSEKIAEEKWEERKRRVDKENLFICLMERDGIEHETLQRLATVSARGLVVFTANDHLDIPYAVRIPKYSELNEVGNILSYSYLTGKREYEKYFDFVKWFNEANGASYDVRAFVKIH